MVDENTVHIFKVHSRSCYSDPWCIRKVILHATSCAHGVCTVCVYVCGWDACVGALVCVRCRCGVKVRRRVVRDRV